MALNRAETAQVELGGQWYSYRLERSERRRTLALQIDAEGLRVIAPARLPQIKVEQVLRDRAGWIAQKLAERICVLPVRWQHGLMLAWLGEPLQLEVQANRNRIVRDGNRLLAPQLDANELQHRVANWYRHEASRYVLLRFEQFRPLLTRMPAEIRLTSARGRWGSCTAAGVVRINWRLMLATPAEMDYVLAHELAHLRHLDHSAAFWQEVSRLLPAYAAARERLRREGHTYQRIFL